VFLIRIAQFDPGRRVAVGFHVPEVAALR